MLTRTIGASKSLLVMVGWGLLAPCVVCALEPFTARVSLDEVRLEIDFGAGLDPSRAVPTSALFDFDVEQMGRFEELLKAELGGVLINCGISHTIESSDSIDLMFFGRPLPNEEQAGERVYLIRIALIRDRDDISECNDEDIHEMYFLGVVNDSSLESDLMRDSKRSLNTYLNDYVANQCTESEVTALGAVPRPIE